MLGRIVWFFVSLAVLVLAFFFAVAAIAAGVILAAALLGRIWWINRRIRKAAEDQIITTEYAVVERESHQIPSLPETSDDSGKR